MNLKHRVLFMSGFPRAGSTLLMNILAQNPQLYATPTSGLIDMVTAVRDNWHNSTTFKSNEEDYVYPKIKTLLRGMIYSFYADQLKLGLIPIDKSRGWVSHIDLLDELFDTRVRFIYPIRDVIDVLISFEKVRRKSSLIGNGLKDLDPINERTSIGRAENLLKPGSVVGLPILLLRELIYREEIDRLILVVFDDLLLKPQETMNYVYEELGMDNFKHDFNNIKQVTIEYDTQHGEAPRSLHTIQNKIVPTKIQRDLSVYDKDFIDRINNEYQDISTFIKVNSLTKK